jgi:hypothetical protein
MIECTACHVSMTADTSNASGGPHGMHPLGATWIDHHPDLIDHGSITRTQCRACHGTDYRGTVLSRVQADRVLDADDFGTQHYWRGQMVSCYDCHNGANSEDPTANTPATVGHVTTNTLSGAIVSMSLPAIDPNGDPLSFRVVSQPAHGSVGIGNNIATYFPEPGYVGMATFTFAAFDSWADSNRGTGTVSIAQGPCSIQAKPLVPDSYPATWPAPFGVIATPVNASANPTFHWNFGDASEHSADPHTTHTYPQPGSYHWTLTAFVQSGATTASNIVSGTIVIGEPVSLGAAASGDSITLSWPTTTADALLEETVLLSSHPNWTVTTNVIEEASTSNVTVPNAGAKFYRLRKVR